ncbi:MAG: hypothetical protein CFH01_01841, partial [Alphaproteobacteria bacterium MarineAlpha2_Bin1]
KIKTMIQFISLGMLLLAYASNIKIIFHIGSLFLWLTALLTIISGILYMNMGFNIIKKLK